MSEDLVDKCTSGDQVNITGYLIRKTYSVVENQRILSSAFLLANILDLRRKVTESNVSRGELTKIFRDYWLNYETNPLEGRYNILASMAPGREKVFRLIQTFHFSKKVSGLEVMEVRVAMYHLWWDEKVFGMADMSMWTM